MKAGDKVKITNYKDDSYHYATVLEVYDECVKIKHPQIAGAFIFSKKHVLPLNEKCDSCECDPCDCNWGIE